MLQNNDLKNNKVMQKIRIISNEINDLNSIQALLHWDQEAFMPPGAAEDRAVQLSTLSKIIHQKETASIIDELLKKAKNEYEQLSKADQALIRVMRRDFDQKTLLPEEFVTEFTKLTSQALQCWISARKQSDFSKFQPFLEKIVDMSLKKAEYLGYVDHPYDALLDIYEEDLKTAQVSELFEAIKKPLQKILEDNCKSENDKFVFKKPFDEKEQAEFSKLVLRTIGYDFNRGREDKTTHPFTTSLGHNDRRVTNRFNPDTVDFIFSALHEGGHALYEQGIDRDLAGTHLDTGVSLGIHESQSRLWENMVGRSLSFWNFFYPELQRAFPDHFGEMPLKYFMNCINRVKPSLIRVDADEVTYNFHVLIRFELEKALLEKKISVKDLPALWDQKYQDYLGVKVPNDAQGVLQDIHWSYGSFGYFPTYTLGNIYSAQIWHAFTVNNPDYKTIIENGELSKIREWLKENIYKHGAIYPPKVLIKKITGEKVNVKYFLDYIRQKYSI